MLSLLRAYRWIGPLVAVAAMAMTILPGCGGRTGKVTGRVTLDGQPLKAGSVIFNSATSKKAVSCEIQDGRFSLEGAPVGPGTFTVDTGAVAKYLTQTAAAQLPGMEQFSDEQRQKMQQSLQKQMSPELAKRYEAAQLAPPRYTDPKSSGLSYTVKSGSQDHDLPLNSQGP